MPVTAEKDLVVLARHGDEGAFETLLNETLPKLRPLLIAKYRLQETDVDEVLQNSTIKVWNKLSTFRSESSFLTWFYIIVKNEALDFLKHRNHLEAKEISAHHVFADDSEEEDYTYLSVEQAFEETAASIIEKRELMDAYCAMIRQVMDELSPSHKQIMSIVLEGNKSYKDIAQELGIPVGTVMSRLFFARKKAQQLIIQYANRHAIQLNGVGRCQQSPIS